MRDPDKRYSSFPQDRLKSGRKRDARPGDRIGRRIALWRTIGAAAPPNPPTRNSCRSASILSASRPTPETLTTSGRCVRRLLDGPRMSSKGLPYVTGSGTSNRLGPGEHSAPTTNLSCMGPIARRMRVPLQTVEIALRNACHRELSRHFGSVWHDEAAFTNLDSGVARSVTEAKERLQGLNRVVDTPHLIAELGFGFWTTLLGRRFEQTLWIPALHKAFPQFKAFTQTKISRPPVARRFDYLRGFRNRIGPSISWQGREIGIIRQPQRGSNRRCATFAQRPC